MRVLIDADLLLEVLLNRGSIAKEADEVWQLAKARKIEGFVTSLCFDRIYSICIELSDEACADKIVSSLQSVLVTCSLDKKKIQKARSLNLYDFESALEAICVEELDLDGVVTHCLSNFYSSETKFNVLSVKDLVSLTSNTTGVSTNSKIKTLERLLSTEHYSANQSSQTGSKTCDCGSDAKESSSQSSRLTTVRVKDLSSLTAALVNARCNTFDEVYQDRTATIVDALSDADLTYDFLRQARQGDIAATIQVLNQSLQSFGVRTRAVFANGVLQLLCEAPSFDQLNQARLTEQIYKTLELVAPRNIRKVNINSRVVSDFEPSLVEKLNRPLDEQLLWAQEIKLSRRNCIRARLKSLFGETYQFKKGLIYGVATVGVIATTLGICLLHTARFVMNSDAPSHEMAPQQDNVNGKAMNADDRGTTFTPLNEANTMGGGGNKQPSNSNANLLASPQNSAIHNTGLRTKVRTLEEQPILRKNYVKQMEANHQASEKCTASNKCKEKF